MPNRAKPAAPTQAVQYQYEISTSDGAKYIVTAADDAQAQRVADFAETMHKQGKTDPTAWTGIPDGGSYLQKQAGNESSATGATARGFVRGGTLNFGDEIAAFGNALIPYFASLDNADHLAGGGQRSAYSDPNGFWSAYHHNMEDFAHQKAADERQHPTADRVGNIAGTLSSVGKVTKLLTAAAAKVAPRVAIPLAARYSAAALAAPVRTGVASGVGIGATTGAVSGFGAGDTMENRRKSAGMGALTGGVLGGAIGGTVVGIGPVVARYARMLLGKGTQQEATAQIVKALARDGYDVYSPAGVQALRTELGRYTGKPVSLADIGAATRARAGVGMRSPSAVQQQAIDAVTARAQGAGPRLAGDIRATVAPRTDVHALDQALVDQRATTALPLRQQALFQPTRDVSGKLTLGDANDLGNGETWRSARYVNDKGLPVSAGVRLSADGKTASVNILPTGDGANAYGPEVVKDMLSAFKSSMPGVDVVTGTRITGARSSAASSLPAKTQSVDMSRVPVAGTGAPQSIVVNDPILQNLARLPDAQKALQGALQRAEAERALKVTLGQPIDDIPDMHPGADLDMRTFDHLKRFLDDEVNALYKRGDTQTFKAGQAGQVKDLRNAIRDRLRNVQEDGTVGDTTGPYGHYLDAYSEPSKLIDDLHAGREYGNLDPEQIAAEQAKRSVAGRELYRVGAARNLLDDVKATRDSQANPASRILKSEEERNQLAATGVEPTALQKLQDAIQKERTMGLLHGELKGSQTAARQAAAEDAHAIGSPLPNNPLNPGNWIGAAARNIVNKLGPAHVASINEAALPRLLETDPKAVDKIILNLEASGQKMKAAALRKQVLSNKVARTLGAVIGSPVSLQEDH